MITQMVLRNLYDLEGLPTKPFCVDAESVNLETDDDTAFYYAACQYIEDNYDINTDLAKIDTIYN